MLEEINKYFRHRTGNIGSFQNFKNSGLYEFYGNIFGPLVYTEEKTHNFISLDRKGNIYDDIYYPYGNQDQVGTIIPKMFLETEIPVGPIDPCWKNVADKGFHIIENVQVDPLLITQAVNEAFIPHGLNKDLNMSKSIYHAYFATLMDYDSPELHRSPEYMRAITKACLPFIPSAPPIMQKYILHTADIVKYIHDPSDEESIQGPYSFHMDYFGRLLFMFFLYYSKYQPIVGRELLVGKRCDFEDFSQEALDRSPGVQPVLPSPFEKVSDEKVTDISTIQIQHGTMILMNTLNPMIVHKVLKLRSKNEVVLMTNYLWTKSWPKEED